MSDLKSRESVICNRIDLAEPVAVKACNLLYHRYFADNVRFHSNKLFAFQSIYVDRLNFKIWQLANLGHVDERTFTRYRHEFLEWFEIYDSMPADKLTFNIVQPAKNIFDFNLKKIS